MLELQLRLAVLTTVPLRGYSPFAFNSLFSRICGPPWGQLRLASPELTRRQAQTVTKLPEPAITAR